VEEIRNFTYAVPGTDLGPEVMWRHLLARFNNKPAGGSVSLEDWNKSVLNEVRLACCETGILHHGDTFHEPPPPDTIRRTTAGEGGPGSQPSLPSNMEASGSFKGQFIDRESILHAILRTQLALNSLPPCPSVLGPDPGDIWPDLPVQTGAEAQRLMELTLEVATATWGTPLTVGDDGAVQSSLSANALAGMSLSLCELMHHGVQHLPSPHSPGIVAYMSLYLTLCHAANIAPDRIRGLLRVPFLQELSLEELLAIKTNLEASPAQASPAAEGSLAAFASQPSPERAVSGGVLHTLYQGELFIPQILKRFQQRNTSPDCEANPRGREACRLYASMVAFLDEILSHDASSPVKYDAYRFGLQYRILAAQLDMGGFESPDWDEELKDLFKSYLCHVRLDERALGRCGLHFPSKETHRKGRDQTDNKVSYGRSYGPIATPSAQEDYALLLGVLKARFAAGEEIASFVDYLEYEDLYSIQVTAFQR